MKLTIIIFTLLMLVGCMANNPAMIKDEEHNFDTVSVTFVSTDNPENTFIVNEIAGKSNLTATVNAVTTMYIGKPKCTIYAREPTNQMDKQAFELLGHELWHCLKGRWHNYSELTKKGKLQ